MGHIFAKPKDPVTKEQRTDAIYSIPCNDCDHEYIGQTKRQFSTRLKEHQHLCLEAWHINSAHAPLNRDDGGLSDCPPCCRVNFNIYQNLVFNIPLLVTKRL